MKDSKKSILLKRIWVTSLKTSKFRLFMILKCTNIFSSLKLKPIMKIKVKYPTFKIKTEELIPKILKMKFDTKNDVLKMVLDKVSQS
jgi:hypothetical protein